MLKRRTMKHAMGMLACAGIALGLAVDAQENQKQAGQERVVQIVAQRFSYTPSEIVLQAGQPTVLAFTALDFTHGFSIPELKIRADLLPGQVTRVHLRPEKPGVYEFLCDNFCGAGHEQMNGKIVVKE